MPEKFQQINVGLEDPLVGDDGESAIQVALEAGITKRDARAEAFRSVVDSASLNDKYSKQVSEVNTYFENRELRIDPIRIVTADTLSSAYAASGERHLHEGVENDEGRAIFGRTVVVENEDAQSLFGDDYLLGMGLHEAAHSLSEGTAIAITRELGEVASHDFLNADLLQAALDRPVEVFWDEGFADLTRVRGLRYLGRSNVMSGEPRTIDMNGVSVAVLPSDSIPGLSVRKQSTAMPAEFATAARTSANGKRPLAVAPANLAAYALALLNERVPGLYEDIEFAKYYPNRQTEVIRKIDSVRPGLYRELCKLGYTGQDFATGLEIVMDALSSGIQAK